MVFFHNINPGARVQVKWRGEIESGTIRYAGSLIAKDGDWVGVELDNAGKCCCKYEAQGQVLHCTFLGQNTCFFHDKMSDIEETKVSPVYEIVFCLRAPKHAWKYGISREKIATFSFPWKER